MKKTWIIHKATVAANINQNVLMRSQLNRPFFFNCHSLHRSRSHSLIHSFSNIFHAFHNGHTKSTFLTPILNHFQLINCISTFSAGENVWCQKVWIRQFSNFSIQSHDTVFRFKWFCFVYCFCFFFWVSDFSRVSGLKSTACMHVCCNQLSIIINCQ